MRSKSFKAIASSVILVGTVLFPSNEQALPCGGFFCQLVPIDQAGEQIIFRQDGDMITAVVLIQYVGEASEFSWVVPVPGIPEFSVGSDLVFAPLELATRPQFTLEVTGTQCSDFLGGSSAGPPSAESADNDNVDDGGVTVLQSVAVGPFDIQVVSSDDPDALAVWLDENGYDLTDRGRDLIAPYVVEEKNFVAVKLRQNQGVGDIQPLIMRYQSDIPCVPIRLTAVAAQPDMGVLVWMLGPSRAIPTNYLHVVPNYTRLNWYAGTFNAYASYQNLITEAMNEAGGQGFATDLAGSIEGYLDQIGGVKVFTDELVFLSTFEDDAVFFAALAQSFVFPSTRVMEILRRHLPLANANDEFIYQIPELLRETFTPEALAAARASVIVELNATIIEPLDETLAVFSGVQYMTRLYTTLSADEMTVDPMFTFNSEMEDQPLERKATMHVECGRGWTLTLGEGTGRDGELVIDSGVDPPGFAVSPPIIAQDAVFRTEITRATGRPTSVAQKSFNVAVINGGAAFQSSNPFVRLCGNGFGLFGGGAGTILLFAMLLRFVVQKKLA